MKHPDPTGLTATDRKKAIEIKDVSMYQVEKKHPISHKVIAIERYMVLTTMGNRRFVFRETLEAKDSPIIT